MKSGKSNGTPSIGQKSKFPAIALGLGLAMTAPTWGQTWDGDAADGLWNTPTNWDGNLVPTGSSVTINNGDSVTLSGTAGDTSTLSVNSGSKLSILTDLDGSNDILIDSGGEVTLTSGNVDLHNNKIKLGNGNSTGSPSFFMDGGTFEMDDKLEIYGTGIFQYTAGSFTVNDNIEMEDGSTFRVVGYDGTGLLSFEGMESSDGTGAFEFLPNAAGDITPISMSGASISQILIVNLDALTAAATMTLFDATVAQATFNSISITKTGYGALTPGTQGALNDGEYFLDYAGGSGTDVVLEVNVTGTAAAPVITSITVAGTTATITMTGTDGTDYTCKSSTTLDDGFPTTETTVPPSPINTSGGTATFTVDASEAKKFYVVEE